MCSGRMSSEVVWTPSLTGHPVWSGSSEGGGRVCPADPSPSAPDPGMFCAPFKNPGRGMTSFDNILWAWIAIFQMITQVRHWGRV